jgi:peptide-methionine (S)-S-oxide reductase
MNLRVKDTESTESCLSHKKEGSSNMSGSTETAILAGGCFWGMQDLLRRYPGVISTRVGYTGGDVVNATYRNHGTHAEAIEIVFDREKLSYRKLLEFFFQIHDPTTLNRQGNDRGASYRSAIFFTNDEQRQIAVRTIAQVEDRQLNAVALRSRQTAMKTIAGSVERRRITSQVRELSESTKHFLLLA